MEKLRVIELLTPEELRSSISISMLDDVNYDYFKHKFDHL